MRCGGGRVDLLPRPAVCRVIFKILNTMTVDNGRLMAFTGKKALSGKARGDRKGAYADIILVDRNSLEDVKLLGASFDMWAAPHSERSIKTIPFVMKDGTIYRNEI